MVLLADAYSAYLSGEVMPGSVDERVETVTMVEGIAPAYSIGCSCDFQRTRDAFRPRRMRKTLAALALRYEVLHYCVCQAGSIPYCESSAVELRRDHVPEGSEESENMVLCGIAAKEDLDDMSHTAAGIELRADSSRTMQSAGCRRDLQVVAEVVELGRQHNFLLHYNSQSHHTTMKAGVANRMPDRRLDYMADEHPRCGI
jgi:hypothetical protein